MNERPFRIGIVGGMGPMAGVHLQRLIIEATPATCDQEHVQVLCFTNPHIPDRTQSILADGGNAYVAAVRESIALLERAGVDVLAIPCCTAHARFADLKSGTTTPLIHMVDTAIAHIIVLQDPRAHVGLLTTDGALRAEVFMRAAAGTRLEWVTPMRDEQRVLMSFIARAKSSSPPDVTDLMPFLRALRSRGADAILLGCTELSLYATALTHAGFPIVDPLRILAERLVAMART
ncbi:MAG: amino acid racemase [bacterium]|nr:amino acid racemase [bacterium]